MDIAIINKNALYRETMLKHGKQHSYTKVSFSIDGSKNILSKEEAKQLIEVLDESVKIIKNRIKSSIKK